MTPKSNITNIMELTKDQLVSWLKDHDIETYRAKQIMKWIYFRQADDFEIMTDIKKEIRQLLSLNFTIGRLEKKQIETSQDGSRKYLLELFDRQCIESVLIPEKNYYTLCISSQVGCAQGCRFCLTARGGFVRNLAKGEILAQVRDIMNDLDDPEKLKNIVMMGMGEPLANYKNVVGAIGVITDTKCGLGFSNNKVTLSTAGLVPKLPDLNQDANVNLAISLNATDNKTRDMLMPINKKYPLEILLDACRKYRLHPRQSIMFEYILLKNINDSSDDANRLAKLLRSIKAKINLIPFNEYEGSEFRQPEEDVINNFREILRKNNYIVVTRRSKGRDISAACGQLRVRTAGKGQNKFLKRNIIP
ncbi:MAG: 23S rRNA (adenine(2503)-C(2))-methyltransferase RlmN [Desulfobacteraceae bacterium]|uniref:Probable dual-specificity RNA methyltransferase RlmN n=1 Tax=Candidatus Desulfaltia bathyphila TaxID=2841697 RepID=A0A8J6TCL5_9BACT|nr:23S rRNA (adenine(2503)-C(2))-methyltransferase RlmN [Candidatus Desulfaltia bathyphila]MBL7195910.1 23S rRNA (adenine(2503)-C(2))-methyltransferase RlmN [Desulfobacterales bacterium]